MGECRHCGLCHKCGSPLEQCLDGEEWCRVCRRYRRYRSHGWNAGHKGDAFSTDSPCIALFTK